MSGCGLLLSNICLLVFRAKQMRGLSLEKKLWFTGSFLQYGQLYSLHLILDSYDKCCLAYFQTFFSKNKIKVSWLRKMRQMQVRSLATFKLHGYSSYFYNDSFSLTLMLSMQNFLFTYHTVYSKSYFCCFGRYSVGFYYLCFIFQFYCWF